MSNKHSIASQIRWSGISKSERSRRMSEASLARWDKPENKDPKKRRRLALKMVRARKPK